MSQEQAFQRQVTTETVKATLPPALFKQKTPIFPSSLAELLNDTPPTIAPPPPPTPVEEQYEYTERRAFATTTTPAYYDLQTQDPKELLVIAETVDHFVEFNRQIDADSPKIFASGSLSLTAKGITRVWYQAANLVGTIYILVFKR
jgi:hypothetical protein